MNSTAECLVCRKQRGEMPPVGGVIYEDELVFASHAQLWAGKTEYYLGHLMLETRRHVAGLADLTDEEARAVGLWSARLAGALTATEGVEHVYSFVFGHHVPHLHIHLLPRYPGAPPEYWGVKTDEWPDAPHGGDADVEALNQRVRDHIHSEWL